MASVSNKDIPDEFKMFGELFNLYKKYYYPEDTEEYWNSVIEEFRDLSKRYGTELAKNLSFVVMEELERKAKESKGKE